MEPGKRVAAAWQYFSLIRRGEGGSLLTARPDDRWKSVRAVFSITYTRTAHSLGMSLDGSLAPRLRYIGELDTGFRAVACIDKNDAFARRKARREALNHDE